MIWFQLYNSNPKNKKTSDCVVRALAIATQKPYTQVLDELVEICKKTGYFINDKKCYEKYLKDNNFVKMRQPRKKDNTKYTIYEIDTIIGDSVAVVSCANHLTIVSNKMLLDLWDCRFKTIGNYWVKKL